MDALEALGDDRFHARQAHALGRPVARAALAVVGAGDDDQRLLARHVGLDRFPHAHDLAFRLHPRQRALLHAAVVVAHHFVEQLRVGEGGALRGEVVAAVGGVGIEVLFRQAHLRQVLAGGAGRQDRVGRRQVVGGDVVRQHGQRTHAAQRALAGQRALPVRRAADIGAARPPVVQRADLAAMLDAHVEHRVVDAAELFRLDRGLDHRVDLGVRRPDVLQPHGVAVGVHAQHVLLDVEAHGTGDGVGDHQRRRGQERLLGVRVDAAVEIAVARQHSGGVQVAVDDLLLDLRVQRAAHAVAGGAGEGDDAEAQLFQLWQQAGLLQVQLHRLGTGRQRRLHPWLAHQPARVGVARQQAGGDHIARVGGVGAAGDGGDDHCAVGHQPLGFLALAAFQLGLVGDAALGQVGHRQAPVRVARAGHVAHDRGQVELEHALVLRGGQRVGPQPGGAGVVLHQRHLGFLAAGQAQVVQGLLVDVEHRRGRAVFRAHVGDGGAVADGQRRGAFAEEFEVGPDHALFAQELGQRQHHVGGGDARLRPAAEPDADDVRQAHPRGAAEHHVLGLQAADADGDHAQRIDVRGVAVGADAGVRERHAVLHVDHRRHLLQVDLVHDAVARRDHVHVLEGLLGPVDEVEAVFVAAVLDGAVLGERIRVEAAALHRQRVVDDQLHRHHRVDLGRVAALLGDGVAQAGQVHQRGLAEDVVAHHARREPREIQVAAALDQLPKRIGQGGRIAAAHQVLGQHARGVRQGGVGAGGDGIDRLAGVEVVQRGAGKLLAVIGVHGWPVGRVACVGGGSDTPVLRGDRRGAGGERTGPAPGEWRRPLPARGRGRGRVSRAGPAARRPGLPDRCSWRWGG